jgi:hypothetical protein
MQVLIDIDEYEYKRVKNFPDFLNSLLTVSERAVKYGTPLPPDHGLVKEAATEEVEK